MRWGIIYAQGITRRIKVRKITLLCRETQPLLIILVIYHKIRKEKRKNDLNGHRN